MKKLAIKIFIFISILILGQLLLPPQPKIPNAIRILDHFVKKGPSIVYFGDSTVNWSGEYDKNSSSMSGLLQLLLKKIKVIKVTHYAHHLGVYDAYVQYIVQKGYHPKFIIVPINMRSFSPEWDRQPFWQFNEEQFVTSHINSIWVKFYQPLGVFKFFESRISQWEYAQTKIYNGKTFIGRIKDFDNPSYTSPNDEKTKNKLLFRYMYELTENHRKIKSMLHMVDVLQKNDIKIIFYITPLDVQTAQKYLGEEFFQRLDKNVQLITSLLATKNVPVLDFSKSLDTPYFTWWQDNKELYPNEHLQLLGRMFVVKSLIDQTELKDYLKEN